MDNQDGLLVARVVSDLDDLEHVAWASSPSDHLTTRDPITSASRN
jgi:hypothetical protein